MARSGGFINLTFDTFDLRILQIEFTAQ